MLYSVTLLQHTCQVDMHAALDEEVLADVCTLPFRTSPLLVYKDFLEEDICSY